MSYYYPFGETVYPLVQQDRTPKKVFVLGVYASAVHARWTIGTAIVTKTERQSLDRTEQAKMPRP